LGTDPTPVVVLSASPSKTRGLDSQFPGNISQKVRRRFAITAKRFARSAKPEAAHHGPLTGVDGGVLPQRNIIPKEIFPEVVMFGA
jgi:hypothetical protein